MPLSNDDLKKIKNVVDAGNEYLDSKWETRFQKQDLRMNNIENKIDDLSTKFDERFEQIKRMQTEDIQMAYEEIEVIKKRLKRLESKFGLV